MIRLTILNLIFISNLFSFTCTKIQAEDISSSVFEEAYKDIAAIHIDTDGINGFFPNGISALIDKSENLKFIESENYYSLLQGSKVQARYQMPDAYNAYEWAALTKLIIENAKALSPKLNQYDNEQIYEIIFDGITKNLDRFSRYSAREDSSDALKYGVENKCLQIGITFNYENGSYIAQHIEEKSPADQIGIRNNNIIHEIDNVPINNLSIEKVYEHLCGTPQKKIKVVFENERGDILTENLNSKVLLKPSVKAHLNKNILFIKITRFSPSTSEELKNIFTELGNYQLNGIILDLRQNRGGLLDQAVNVSDAFLDGGMILKTVGKHSASNQVFYATPVTLISTKVPMIILTDNYTASSAEIVTEALKDHNRGIIMGRKTFGKGLVQAVTELPNEGKLYLTWSRIISPSGDSFNKVGIQPLYCYKNPNQKLCQNIYYRFATDPLDMSYYILNNPNIYQELLAHQAKINKTLK